MTHRTKLPSWVWTVAAATFFAIAFGGIASAHDWHAPELDPGTGASGLALLIGGGLLALERYRSR